MPTSVKTVDAYLAAVPAKERAVLQKLREVIGSAAPEAEEVISYNIPLYNQQELGPYEVKHTTIHFSTEKALLPLFGEGGTCLPRIASRRARPSSGQRRLDSPGCIRPPA